MWKNKKIKSIDEILNMPREVCTDESKIFITGFDEIVIQNIKGILEYDDIYISIRAFSGVINISGVKLNLENMLDESIKISGKLDSIEFEKNE